MSTPEEVKAEYTSSLADLTFNSKPLINVLTMLAEENLPNAKIIVEAIEEHLAKVATDVKLPILYLIDCIVKNVGKTYRGLFSQNIVSTFCTVFRMVDEKTRLEMFKLRQTWNDVFPQMKLYAIDVQISQIDPAWPVTAQPSNSIHLNPKFLKNNPTPQAQIPTSVNETVTSVAPVKPVVTDIDKETLLMQEQLIQKQKELLELQRKTLELEVLQTQVKLQEQMKVGGGPPISKNILLKPEVAKQLLPEAMTKVRPTGIANTTNQRLQNHQPRINPVNPALAIARPIRDPRLLRQQQQKSQQPQQTVTTTTVTSEKSTVHESNNKNITNKVGVRDLSKDPRLSRKLDKKSKNSPKSRDEPSVNVDISSGNVPKSTSRSNEKSSSGSPTFSNSTSSSSMGSSSSSSLDSPSKNRRSSSNKSSKKRDKPETKRSKEFDSSRKREKVASREENGDSISDAGKNSLSDISSANFRGVKNKNRNYMRRNLTDSPVQDEDLRHVSNSTETNTKIEEIVKEKSPVPEVSIVAPSVNKPMDVDLRQLPTSAGKKRASTEGSDQPSKKSKSFDVLFGSEDTDLRQLVPIDAAMKPASQERPPTPPPPVISDETKTEPKEEKPVSKKSDLDAIRAKLANATNREKILSQSFHKNKLNQVDQPKKPANITISPEEEKVIKSGQMTREQERQIWNKILTQVENNKLQEAKRKEHEESLGEISLQAISDDEFVSDIEDENKSEPKVQPSIPAPIPPPPAVPPPIAPSQMPFNDKDERLNMHPMMAQNMEMVPPGMDQPLHQPFYPRGGRPPFRGGRDNWRNRGGRYMAPQGPPRGPPMRPWIQQPRWGSPAPFMPPHHSDFIIIDDESSRSPKQQEFGPPELTMIQEEIKTLNIDNIPRDIRVYNDIAVIFMDFDDPREISFQSGSRRVIFNNKESYLLNFGDDYRDCEVNGYMFRVKLGVPSREFFINNLGFECFFGGSPIHITVNGISMSVALDGPPPQVKISEKKATDLVLGKINLIINAKLIIPVFLDAKPQKFVVEGETCTLQFIDALKRVLINGVPMEVKFGGLPKPFTIHGVKHFIRFPVLPKGVKPGFVKIKDMEGESGVSPRRENESDQDGFSGPLEVEPLRPDTSKVNQPPIGSPDNRSNSPSSINNVLQPALNNFDVLSNVFSQSFAPTPTTGGYQVELPGLGPSSAAQENTLPVKQTINVNELFQKLVASGVVQTTKQPEQVGPEVSVNSTPVVPVSNGRGSHQPPKKPSYQEPAPKVQRRSLFDILKTVTFARPETLKVRQAPLYHTLYTGMQCSSCGMRFPPEASMWYSQHLDWHFRQNRRGKKNARVANSRKWYFSLADWKNYEELEDLEEREKNYFDQQQQAEVAEEAEEEVEIPTVPADPGTTNERCHVCRDAFEQFFNEEKEEWHLRNAIKMDDKTYHPVCYEDYQKSILEDTLNEVKPLDISQTKLIPGLEIILDDDDDDAPGTPDEVVSLIDDDDDLRVPEDAPSPAKDEEELPDYDDGDDDDVILNEVAPIKIVVEDDDDENEANVDDEGSDSIVIKKEKKLTFDDGFVDVGEIVTLKEMGQVRIKSEPIDEDDPTAATPMDTSTTSDTQETPTPSNSTAPSIDLDTIEPSPVTTHPQMISSMDGNVEMASHAQLTVPTTISGGTKIKINISKPLPVIPPKETTETSDNSEVVKSSEVQMEEPEILSYKPALQNVPLKKLPPVQKGHELTGLCSIM